MLGRIILGLIIVVIGAIITIYSEAIYRFIGPIPSAEKYLGTEGGSRLAYKLIGILGCIIGFMVMTNLIAGVFGWIFTNLFGGFGGR